MLFEEVTHKIIGAAMAAHSKLVCGFQELIYQRALALEFGKTGVVYEREKEMKIYYENEEIGTRRVDFLIESNICVEIKAIQMLEEIHFVQALNYLEVYDLPVGLLINFGAKSLGYKRIYNNKHPLNKKNP